MGQQAQAAINAVGGYAVGRMEGRGRRRGRREREMDMSEYRDSLQAHLAYLGQYNELRKDLAEHANGLAMAVQQRAHDLGLIAAEHRAGIEEHFANLAHQHTTEQAEQAHRHATEQAAQSAGLSQQQAEQNANLSQQQFTHRAGATADMFAAMGFKPEQVAALSVDEAGPSFTFHPRPDSEAVAEGVANALSERAKKAAETRRKNREAKAAGEA